MTGVRIGLALLLLAFWFALSDQYTVLFAVMAVASSVGVAWFTSAFFADILGPSAAGSWPRLLPRPGRTAVYIGWLAWRALVSSLEVAWVVVRPSMPLEPGFVRFRTGLTKPLARTTLANSITLVPGTLTVRVVGDEFLIHALWPAAADDVRTGELQRRIAVMFDDHVDEGPIEATWEPAEGLP